MRTQSELQAERLSTTRPAAGGGRAVPVSGSHFWGPPKNRRKRRAAHNNNRMKRPISNDSPWRKRVKKRRHRNLNTASLHPHRSAPVCSRGLTTSTHTLLFVTQTQLGLTLRSDYCPSLPLRRHISGQTDVPVTLRRLRARKRCGAKPDTGDRVCEAAAANRAVQHPGQRRSTLQHHGQKPRCTASCRSPGELQPAHRGWAPSSAGRKCRRQPVFKEPVPAEGPGGRRRSSQSLHS